MKINEAPKFSETITKQKERHIVTWSQEEDDILREQISIHGTDNWTIIASNFKDKTTRQCRRRWYTYLNSDFKKGGWSPEEDMLLCEAQKLFGNRWTEIAKVVSGRTDNAVKNRFNTLCRKRAKHESMSKENESSCINSNDKRVILQNGFITDTATESVISLKKMRTHISDVSEKCNQNERLFKECGTMENKQLRPPFAVIVQNTQCVYDVAAQREGSPTRMSYNDGKKIKDQGTFLKRNDPKITFLMQQAELLSSLATKVNAENNTQSFENAWKELQLFLNRTQENDVPSKEFSETDFCLEDFKDLIEDLRSSSTRTHQDSRQADLPDESPGCSDNSTESTQQSYRVGEKTEQTQIDVSSRQQRTCVEPQSVHTLEENYGGGCSQDGFSRTSADNVRQQLIHTEAANDGAIVCSEGLDTSTNDAQVMLVPSLDREKDGIITTLPSPVFSSPLQVTPLFQTFAAGMPSPRFSESERNFLLKTLGQESMPANPSQPPPCKRSLLHSL